MKKKRGVEEERRKSLGKILMAQGGFSRKGGRK